MAFNEIFVNIEKLVKREFLGRSYDPYFPSNLSVYGEINKHCKIYCLLTHFCIVSRYTNLHNRCYVNDLLHDSL
jgi:hypothetical protein